MLTDNTTIRLNPEGEPMMADFILKKLPYDLSSLLFDSSQQKTYQSYNEIKWLVVIF